MAEAKKDYLMQVYDGLNARLDSQVSALPKDLNKQRFLQNCMSVLTEKKTDFSKVEASSVVRTLMRGAYLGLDFFHGECYAIPFGDQVNFLVDYKGDIKLCKKYSRNPIKDIYAKVVREGDEFVEEINNGQASITFRPKPFNNGDIIGAFAVCLYVDGSMIYDTMSKAEIDHTRNTFSKAANSKAWKESYGEMAKKTVLKRLCKLIDLEFDNADQDKSFEEGGDFTPDKEPEKPEKAKDVYAEDIVDAEVIANDAGD